jgi:endoglucanase
LGKVGFANETQSETGGGSTSTCETYLCQAIAFLNANSDGKLTLSILKEAIDRLAVYLGYIGWAAGSFDSERFLPIF